VDGGGSGRGTTAHDEVISNGGIVMTEKEFWEKCGWEWHPNIRLWKSPPPENCLGYGTLPELDLDNLFKYAVPKLKNPKITLSFYSSIRDWYCRVQVDHYPFDVALWANKEEHAHVLYNAIVKVFEQEKELADGEIHQGQANETAVQPALPVQSRGSVQEDGTPVRVYGQVSGCTW
jgi:hypothetical protein